MHGLSLWNPYSTLAAIGAKKWETRNWRPIKKPKLVAIHSTASSPQHALKLVELDAFRQALVGQTMRDGHILAVAEIGEIITTQEWIRRFCRTGTAHRHEAEYMFGDYGPQRFAWELKNVQRLPEPIPCKGGQRLWTVPAPIEEQIKEQLHRQNAV